MVIAGFYEKINSHVLNRFVKGFRNRAGELFQGIEFCGDVADVGDGGGFDEHHFDRRLRSECA
tara:strand:- start:50231 stop:50419 length:189 start_codon:yes stop_codon:yes gene_type:complete